MGFQEGEKVKGGVQSAISVWNTDFFQPASTGTRVVQPRHGAAIFPAFTNRKHFLTCLGVFSHQAQCGPQISSYTTWASTTSWSQLSWENLSLSLAWVLYSLLVIEPLFLFLKFTLSKKIHSVALASDFLTFQWSSVFVSPVFNPKVAWCHRGPCGPMEVNHDFLLEASLSHTAVCLPPAASSLPISKFMPFLECVLSSGFWLGLREMADLPCSSWVSTTFPTLFYLLSQSSHSLNAWWPSSILFQ